MDEDGHDPGDVFVIPDLWGPSKLLYDPSGLDGDLFSRLRLDDIDTALPKITPKAFLEDVFFHTPDFSFGLDNQSPKLSPPPDVFEESPVIVEQKEDGDIWTLPDEITIQPARYQSWDAFENQKPEDYHTPYLSEAGPLIFDAAIASTEDYLHAGNIDRVVLNSKVYVASVWALGVGRNSVLFNWDDDKQKFLAVLPKMRISGYTGKALDDLLVMFLECGNITRFLQRFVDKAYVKHTSPGRIALADAVSILLATIQARLSSSAIKSNSLLQLQSHFQPVHSILTCFQRIVINAMETRSDESMLSTIFEEIQLLEHRTDALRDILLEILSRVSQPWLEFASEWLGIHRESGLPMSKDGESKSFVIVENREWVDEQGLEMHEPDYILDYDKVPSFISPEDARAMFEVGKSLRFLKVHHTDHPLAKPDIVEFAQPPTLEWKFSWQDIVQVEAKALQYEKDLTKTIREFSSEGPSSSTTLRSPFELDIFKLDFFGRPEEEMQAHVLASIDTFNRPLNNSMAPDNLSLSLDAYFSPNSKTSGDEDSVFAPPVSLSPILSFNPIISAQARLVNRTCMRMFFNSHNLREHLTVQRNFHLLGNGVFASRLSHALFDPELESAERHMDIVRSGGMMGLRLGGRDTWPPASSELRLALMGVLTDSYIFKQALNTSRLGTFLDQTSLPGDLSFAVRDMSDEEIEGCMNPDSLEALDFLRLSYKPPAPLEAVITPVILFKYDQLFKLLLRVMRMLYVVTALFRDTMDQSSNGRETNPTAQRFRIEAQHFISSICGYFFDTGIATTWQIFERKLDQVEQRLKTDDADTALGHNEGLDKLRDYHERVLDRIMFALLLRKRQQPVMKLLEEIFTLILQFSKHCREKAEGVEHDVESGHEVNNMYLKFRKKVGVFIMVCRGMNEKKGYGDSKTWYRDSREGGLFDGDDLAEESTIAHLLSRLEMSDYYSRVVKV